MNFKELKENNEFLAFLEKIKEELTPTKEEREELMNIFKELKSLLSKHFPPSNIILLGSVAKDTFLRGYRELDIFILFPETYSKEEMGESIFSALDSLGIKYDKKYAEHPYASFVYKGAAIDLVPAYKIKKPELGKSAVDRTPFHYEFVKKNLKEEQKGEVRLLKKYLKNFNLYGAESAIGGFSGYLCELLIIKYNTFLDLLISSLEWKKGELLFLKTPPSFPVFNEPLVFLDPTDPYRNVASALREENLYKFILTNISFLSFREREYFFLTREKTRDYFGKTVVVEFPSPLEVVEEIRGAQLRRIEKTLVKALESKGFLISNSSILFNNKAFVLISSPIEVPRYKIKNGPPISMVKNAIEFAKNNFSFLKEDRLVSYKIIENTDLLSNVREELSKMILPSHYRDKEYKVYEISKAPKEVKDFYIEELRRYYLMVGRWKD